MNPCRRDLDWLLEADAAALRGEGSGDDASHVRGCTRCRALAEEILRAERLLSEALDSPGERPDFDALIERARRGDRRMPLEALRRARPAWLAVAAATLAALLVVGDRERPLPGAPVVPRTVGVAPLVETSGDRDVAVITTDDPDITVIWFF